MIVFSSFSLQNWLAFSTSQKPFFSEQNSVYFANSNNPPADFNNAFCKVSIFSYCFSNGIIIIYPGFCISYFHILISLFCFCFQDIHFSEVYRNAPNVFVSAKHFSTGKNLDPMHNSITAWVEVRNLCLCNILFAEFQFIEIIVSV